MNFGKSRILPTRSRIIVVPKRAGFLPLILLFAAFGAVVLLGGGRSAINKAVTASKMAGEQLADSKRHNVAMELYIKQYRQGCGISNGHGLSVRPFKSGCCIDVLNSGYI